MLLTIVNYSKFQNVKTDSAAVTDNAMPSVALIADINLAFANARCQLLFHIIQTDAAHKTEVQNALNADLAVIREKFKAYDAYVSNAEDQQNINNVRTEID